MSYYQDSSIIGSARIFGCRTSNNVRAFIIGSQSGTVSTVDTYYGQIGNANYYNLSNPSNTSYKKTNIKLDKTGLMVDDNYVRTFSNVRPFTTEGTLILFGSYNTNSETIENSVKGMINVYNCNLYENNILVRNFIPALDVGGRPCMYDIVTGQPFYIREQVSFYILLNR